MPAPTAVTVNVAEGNNHWANWKQYKTQKEEPESTSDSGSQKETKQDWAAWGNNLSKDRPPRSATGIEYNFHYHKKGALSAVIRVGQKYGEAPAKQALWPPFFSNFKSAAKGEICIIDSPHLQPREVSQLA